MLHLSKLLILFCLWQRRNELSSSPFQLVSKLPIKNSEALIYYRIGGGRNSLRISAPLSLWRRTIEWYHWTEPLKAWVKYLVCWIHTSTVTALMRKSCRNAERETKAGNHREPCVCVPEDPLARRRCDVRVGVLLCMWKLIINLLNQLHLKIWSIETTCPVHIYCSL